MKPHPKSEMLTYAGGKTVTFRAFVGEEFKDTSLDVQSVLARHHDEKESPVRLLDFSLAFCRFEIKSPEKLTVLHKVRAAALFTYTGEYLSETSIFFNWFFAQEVEDAILLDLEQEYKTELGERGDVEAEDRNDIFNCL